MSKVSVPVSNILCPQTLFVYGTYDYWAWNGRYLGKWHEPAQKIKPGVKIGKAAQGN